MFHLSARLTEREREREREIHLWLSRHTKPESESADEQQNTLCIVGAQNNA
jgi:DNA-binding CsgD family transcriptional regulator